jgi:hypothetical protein
MNCAVIVEVFRDEDKVVLGIKIPLYVFNADVALKQYCMATNLMERIVVVARIRSGFSVVIDDRSECYAMSGWGTSFSHAVILELVVDILSSMKFQSKIIQMQS